MTEALNDLNRMIERIRKEADAEGYARAMRDVASFAAAKSNGPVTKLHAIFPPPPAKDVLVPFEDSKGGAGRAPRGQNKARVREILSDHAVPMSMEEIRLAMEERHEEPFAYSSTQNALTQLEREGLAEVVGRGVWRLKRIDDGLDDLLA